MLFRISLVTLGLFVSLSSQAMTFNCEATDDSLGTGDLTVVVGVDLQGKNDPNAGFITTEDGTRCGGPIGTIKKRAPKPGTRVHRGANRLPKNKIDTDCDFDGATTLVLPGELVKGTKQTGSAALRVSGEGFTQAFYNCTRTQ